MNTLIFMLCFLVGERSVVVERMDRNYSPAFIWYAVVGSMDDSTPTPIPTPKPDGKVKIGDVCPICKGTGKQSTDGVVKLDCIHCDGDGKVDEGDPILGGKKPEGAKRVETYSFSHKGNTYFYVEKPNKFYSPSTKTYFSGVPTNWWKGGSFKKCFGTYCMTFYPEKDTMLSSELPKTQKTVKKK